MAHPSNVSMSVGHLAQLVDDIWYLAGDKSADVGIKSLGHSVLNEIVIIGKHQYNQGFVPLSPGRRNLRTKLI